MHTVASQLAHEQAPQASSPSVGYIPVDTYLPFHVTVTYQPSRIDRYTDRYTDRYRSRTSSPSSVATVRAPSWDGGARPWARHPAWVRTTPRCRAGRGRAAGWSRALRQSRQGRTRAQADRRSRRMWSLSPCCQSRRPNEAACGHAVWAHGTWGAGPGAAWHVVLGSGAGARGGHELEPTWAT